MNCAGMAAFSSSMACSTDYFTTAPSLVFPFYGIGGKKKKKKGVLLLIQPMLAKIPQQPSSLDLLLHPGRGDAMTT